MKKIIIAVRIVCYYVKRLNEIIFDLPGFLFLSLFYIGAALANLFIAFDFILKVKPLMAILAFISFGGSVFLLYIGFTLARKDFRKIITK